MQFFFFGQNNFNFEKFVQVERKKCFEGIHVPNKFYHSEESVVWRKLKKYEKKAINVHDMLRSHKKNYYFLCFIESFHNLTFIFYVFFYSFHTLTCTQFGNRTIFGTTIFHFDIDVF